MGIDRLMAGVAGNVLDKVYGEKMYQSSDYICCSDVRYVGTYEDANGQGSASFLKYECTRMLSPAILFHWEGDAFQMFVDNHCEENQLSPGFTCQTAEVVNLDCK